MDLIKYVMAPEFVTKICHGNYHLLSREYLMLDYSLQIEVPDYDGPFLKPTVRNFLGKVSKKKSIIHDRIIYHTSYKFDEK